MKTVKRLRNRYLCLMDALLTFVAFTTMTAFEFPVATLKGHILGGMDLIIATALVFLVVLGAFSIYNTDWVRAAHRDYLRLAGSCLCASMVSIIIGQFVATDVFFLKFNIITTLANSVLVCMLRFGQRIIYKTAMDYWSGSGKNVLIIGAGRLSVVLLREIIENERMNFNVVGLIDDDPQKFRNHIHGVKVLGNRNDIVRVCENYCVDEIIFAIHTIDSKQRRELLDICSETGKKVKILPGIEETLAGENQLQQIREINIEDLLEREPVSLDNKIIEDDICNKVVLVTGGGGSIGSELCRQILKYNPKKLIILDIYENTTYELQNELAKLYPTQCIEVFIASIRDKARLDEIFGLHKPEIVFHAAAHKHVPLMEHSPAEAIKNNVFGTYNTAMCAAENGVKRFVMISTDKAVNPTNVMGATKRMCEMIIQTLQSIGKTDFVAVRFGNVLGSHGSVVPHFKKQIEDGGPVTVTHPEITRFFMTIPEAAQLVLQAAAYAKGGEIFVKSDRSHVVL